MSKKLCLLFLAMAALIPAQNVFAKDRTHQIGLGLNLGVTIPVAPTIIRTDTNPSVVFGVHGRYFVDATWGAVVDYDHLDFGNSPVAADSFSAGAFLRPNSSSDWSPWLSLGIGQTRVGSYGGIVDYWRFAVRVEAGAEYDCSENISVAGKLAYLFITKNVNTMHVLMPMVAGTWHFGKP